MTIFDPKAKLWANHDAVCQWRKAPWGVWPVSVEIAPTNRCNHACTHCLYTHTRGSEEISPDILDNLLVTLSKVGVKAVIWAGGGEPLLYKESEKYNGFEDVYSWWQHFLWKANNLGLKQGFYTNLTRFEAGLYDDLLDTQEWIRVSVDAATPETYEKIRGVDDFERVCENIERLVSRKKHSKSTCMIGVGMVVSQKNKHEMRDFVSLFSGFGTDYIQIKPSSRRSDFTNYFEYLEAREDASLIGALGLAETTKYKWDAVYWDKHYEDCKGHAFTTFVGADAKVYLCSTRQGDPRLVLGDLTKQGFREIWSGARRQEVYESIKGLEDCLTACRCHEINKALQELDTPQIRHKEFL